jgi:hypothetical protein
MASRSAAACWAALVRAARTRTLLARRAVVDGFLTAGFFAVDTVFFWADTRVAALDCAGAPIVATIATKQKSLDVRKSRVRITCKPLWNRLLRIVSAL